MPIVPVGMNTSSSRTNQAMMNDIPHLNMMTIIMQEDLLHTSRVDEITEGGWEHYSFSKAPSQDVPLGFIFIQAVG